MQWNSIKILQILAPSRLRNSLELARELGRTGLSTSGESRAGPSRFPTGQPAFGPRPSAKISKMPFGEIHGSSSALFGSVFSRLEHAELYFDVEIVIRRGSRKAVSIIGACFCRQTAQPTGLRPAGQTSQPASGRLCRPAFGRPGNIPGSPRPTGQPMSAWPNFDRR